MCWIDVDGRVVVGVKQISRRYCCRINDVDTVRVCVRVIKYCVVNCEEPKTVQKTARLSEDQHLKKGGQRGPKQLTVVCRS